MPRLIQLFIGTSLLICAGVEGLAQFRPPRLPPTTVKPPSQHFPMLPPPIISLPPRMWTPPPPQIGGPPPPPPPPNYWIANWQRLDPRECQLRSPGGVRCEVVAGWKLKNALSDPNRNPQTVMLVVAWMAKRQAHLAFHRSEPLTFRLQVIHQVYRATDAAFAQVLNNFQQTMLEAPAATRARRGYAIMDSAAVERLRSEAATERSHGLSEALREAETYPSRNSVELRTGPAYRQAVNISLGTSGFD